MHPVHRDTPLDARRYITAGLGALANSGRNTRPLDHINNWDAQLRKTFNFTERFKFDIGVQAFNLFNHSQFVGGASTMSPRLRRTRSARFSCNREIPFLATTKPFSRITRAPRKLRRTLPFRNRSQRSRRVSSFDSPGSIEAPYGVPLLFCGPGVRAETVDPRVGRHTLVAPMYPG